MAGGAGEPFLGKSCWDLPELINGTVGAIRAEPAQQEAAPKEDNLLFLAGGGIVLLIALIPVSPVVHSTLQATQGQILSQSPTDATSGR